MVTTSLISAFKCYCIKFNPVTPTQTTQETKQSATEPQTDDDDDNIAIPAGAGAGAAVVIVVVIVVLVLLIRRRRYSNVCCLNYVILLERSILCLLSMARSM